MRGSESARKKPPPSWRIVLHQDDVYNRRRCGSGRAPAAQHLAARARAVNNGTPEFCVGHQHPADENYRAYWREMGNWAPSIGQVFIVARGQS